MFINFFIFIDNYGKVRLFPELLPELAGLLFVIPIITAITPRNV
jgi:hypothetical protein